MIFDFTLERVTFKMTDITELKMKVAREDFQKTIQV